MSFCAYASYCLCSADAADAAQEKREDYHRRYVFKGRSRPEYVYQDVKNDRAELTPAGCLIKSSSS